MLVKGSRPVIKPQVVKTIPNVENFLRHCQRREYKAKSVVLKQGEVSDSLHLILDGSVSVMVDFRLPDGKPITDQFFGAVEVYYDRVSADIDFQQLPGSSEQLLIQFQGCADWGFCYPPQSDAYWLNPESNQLN